MQIREALAKLHVGARVLDPKPANLTPKTKDWK